jgi:hypothetical protein
VQINEGKVHEQRKFWSQRRKMMEGVMCKRSGGEFS